jgi:hypothetical protein
MNGGRPIRRLTDIMQNVKKDCTDKWSQRHGKHMGNSAALGDYVIRNSAALGDHVIRNLSQWECQYMIKTAEISVRKFHNSRISPGNPSIQ